MHFSYEKSIEISELEPDTLYAFKVQAVKQNLEQAGPFSETVFCRTRHKGDFHISGWLCFERTVDSLK